MAEPRTPAAPRLGWRVIDFVTAAVLAVACGLIFLVWNQVGGAGYELFGNLAPGLGGLATGIWMLGGPLGGFIIRKPGAALFVELLAASVSAALGSQWGITTLYSGLVQGLGAELFFLLFAYRRYTIATAALAGAGAFCGAWAYEFVTGNYEKALSVNLVYLGTGVVSGALLGGVLAGALTRARAATGALDRFAAGRQARQRV